MAGRSGQKKLLQPSISESLFCKEKIQTARFHLGTMLPVVPSKIDAIIRNDRSQLNTQLTRGLNVFPHFAVEGRAGHSHGSRDSGKIVVMLCEQPADQVAFVLIPAFQTFRFLNA